MSEIPQLLSTGAAAKALGCGRTKLLMLVRSSRIPCRMLDGRIRIALADITAFADSLPTGYRRGQAVTSSPKNLGRAAPC